MKRTLLLASALLVLFSCQKPATEEDIVKYAGTITQDELKEHLYTYASDEFEGRDTGEPGQKKAVEYLKTQYESLGIESVIEGNYFQNVPLNVVNTPKVDISINGKAFNYFEDFISLTPADKAKVSVEDIVYVGYGIDDEKYSDYKDLDVNGKIVIAKSGEPKAKDGKYIISGTEKVSKWGNGRQGIRSREEAAKENGAAALFFVDDRLFKSYSAYFKRRSDAGRSSRLSLPAKEDAEAEIHYFLISEKMGKAIVKNMKSSAKPTTVATKLDINFEPDMTPKPSENVAAIIRGTEKPDEYIIISSHLDHVGTNEKGEVFNGADDDGSGTVAILEIAEAFKTAAENGHGPKRSIIFLNVTGEEKGLLGSRYYTDYQPLVPLANTVANLNIDMVGRIDPKREGDRNYIYLIGSDKLSTELHELSEDMNKKYMNIELDYTYNDENDPNRFYYRSDHYNFAKNNIPIIFYFNGTHDDYHRTSDTPDKINYDLLENRARLVFHTAWEVANRDKRIEADKAEKQDVKP